MLTWQKSSNFAASKLYITEYTGNIETYYTREDTVRRVFNAEGYRQQALTQYGDSLFNLTDDDGFYYYYRDHLGTTRVVKNLTKDTTVQRMSYYASGLPMQSCEGSSAQNRKYNGKEFIEAYGLDEYDYGFRGYYPAIGRFTSPDPLAEMNPSVSNYSYANNNGVNNIDFMGLSPRHQKDFDMFNDEIFRYTEINTSGRVITHIDDEDDKRVMLIGEDGNMTELGTEVDYGDYTVGKYYIFFLANNGQVYMYFPINKSDPAFEDKVARWLYSKNVDDIERKLLEIERPIVQGLILFNPLLDLINNIKILTVNSNIYGTEADQTDKALATLSLVLLGVDKSNVITNWIFKEYIIKILELSTTMTSVFKTTKDEKDKKNNNGNN